MVTPTPRYIGDGIGTLIPDFSDALKTSLKKFFPGEKGATQISAYSPVDVFVGIILSEAWWAKAELHWQTFGCSKQELRAEQADLLGLLNKLDAKLRSLSPDFDRLLNASADPLGCADRVKELAWHVEMAGQVIEQLPKAPKLAEKHHAVAVELAIRVLRVLKEYGIQPNVTGNTYFGYTSDAVEILKLIGDDIRLVRDVSTWRDTISEAKQASPDLR